MEGKHSLTRYNSHEIYNGLFIIILSGHRGVGVNSYAVRIEITRHSIWGNGISLGVGLRAHSVLVVSTSTLDRVMTRNIWSNCSWSYGTFLEDLVLLSVPVVCYRPSSGFSFSFTIWEIYVSLVRCLWNNWSIIISDSNAIKLVRNLLDE